MQPCAQNCLSDALSRQLSMVFHFLRATYQPISYIWEVLHHFFKSHMATYQLLESIRKCPANYHDFTIKEEVLLFKGWVFIPLQSALQPILISEFHNSTIGGHAEVHKTVTWLLKHFIS